MSVPSRLAARLGRLPAAETGAVGVERDLPMLAEADVTLLADHWFPEGADLAGVPIVLLRSPYGRRQLGLVGRLLAERGYQVVIQSCRGTFGSGGEWVPFRNERHDGLATFEWLATQPWWSARVATFGPSYLGLTQWAVVAGGAAPPGLAAIAPSVTAARFRDIVVYPGGSFTLETGATWLYLLAHQELGRRRVAAAQVGVRRRLGPAYTTLPLAEADSAGLGRRVGFYQDWLVHDRPGDAWWDPVDFAGDHAAVPPASLVGGWYDIFLPAQIDDFTALVAAGRDARLTVGPWTHSSLRGSAAALADAIDWFDTKLRDRPARRHGLPVRLWVIGREDWVDLPSWPPPAQRQRWYLHPDGLLDPAPPTDGGPRRFRYDPADPTPGVGGPSLNAANAGSRDQRRREDRPDVVVWTTPPFTAPTVIAGPLRAELWVSASSAYFDVSVRLCRVSASGRSTNLSDGILRLEAGPDGTAVSAGDAVWGSVTTGADGVSAVTLRMWPTAVEVAPGERLRVQVAGGAHPLFARNPGSGEPLGSATTLVVVDVAVHHDAAHPSALELPVSPI